MAARVFDCLIFAGELDVLEWRLHEGAAYVDQFVIVEATRTFSGLPKSLYYREHADRFAAFADRIRYVVCDTLPDYAVGTGRMYETEGIQRNQIAAGFTDALDTDLVMISDCDEIPRAAVVMPFIERYDAARRNGSPRPIFVTTLLQTCHYYFINLVGELWTPWKGTRIAPASIARQLGGQGLRMYEGSPLGNAGWHFSFFGGVADIQRKLSGWSHIELDRPPMNQPDWIARCWREGKDWDAARDAPLVWTPITAESAPRYVLDNLDKWDRYVGKGRTNYASER